NYAFTNKYIVDRQYQVPYLDFLEAVNTALVKSGFKEVNVHPKNGVFTAKTGFSMSSWMEFIEVRCEQKADNIHVNFLSICGLPTQIFAWGKNRRNAERFFRELDNSVQNSANTLQAA